MAANDERIVSNRFPYVPIQLEIGNQTLDVEALLDTGFDGDVVIPQRMVPSGLAPDGRLRWGLADNSTISTSSFRGTVRVGDFSAFRVMISAVGDAPIVGCGVCDRFTITLIHGTQVVVER